MLSGPGALLSLGLGRLLRRHERVFMEAVCDFIKFLVIISLTITSNPGVSSSVLVSSVVPGEDLDL